ncbi:MAG: creatininase family protein [Caldibacillus debilis]|jgi:creatinine amidohydrolase|uniref:Creatininase family protein n=2 Tax=Caldibacillus debilis TaxID=301148 RepID=A0A150M712_9BACI|nr:creatininase family protein [Caldibacillus debilis]MBO2481275.1 creatininase [Bacillaceae bacterium]KYD20012.1 Creatinine amidohydrolase [Caldibacillus debilis]OUM93347.1 MAG: creatinine amidohydrolase [Caldibacillus debilis]REJ16793.1 MAG: creatininase family protein [Caldibacillus debilis]REJ28964.1 MAG: creatininase family protein [Caldibacillus debilis]
MMNRRYAYENSFEVKEKIDEVKIAILPIGAVEAHGPHLPLATDNILAERLSERLAEKVGAFVLPTLPYGQVWSLRDFPGSITVSNESLIRFLVDIGSSLYNQGFRIWAMVNAHLGNQTALKEAARILYDRHPDFKIFYFFYPGMNTVAKGIRETEAVHSTYFHACELETSIMLYLAEEFTDMEKAIRDIPQIPEAADYTPTPWQEFTKTAVLGDATLATKEKGEVIVETALERMADILRRAKDELV